MIRRPRRTVPATIVALVLLAICVLVTIAVLQSLTGHQPFVTLPQLLSVTSGQHWNSAAIIAIAIVLAVIGLLLLLVALRPGQPVVLPLARQVGPDGEPGADAGVRRATLTKDLASVASGVPGVMSASVMAGRRTVTATITAAGSDTAEVPGQVRERLTERLADISPASQPSVRVRVRRDRST